ncbi:aminotransferase class I/II-fold pyridoxal phosphate-dependent enzyme [Nonomuraea phyllanthi]|uniref:Aminotransferase class I/II-fold pyridoxal phosphate-dependent enzyme n=1 Tax=Nonomuraea phyllanthi TaxID=2219224 RepID=A0A5C4VVU3_9ACTN|nr:PLP-dependent aminotransferase family protein [Nonomuraea phyllanthi]KAB8190325.1 aminotransferase class I/II-fold pyridoxal phosphate-dependent enzyme [Nonomuraea phyllanthi]
MTETLGRSRPPSGPGAARPSGLDLLLEIPKRGGRRRAVEESLRAAIREGRLAAGTRLPSSRDMAAQLGLSRGTVAAAYEQLVAEGWLTARSGSGTRVAAGAAAPAPPASGRVAPAAARHDLGPGRSDARAFPRDAWSHAMRHVLREAPAEAFGFGDPQGRIELRTTLAAYLGRVRGVRVDPAGLVICSGYTQALGLLTEVFAELGVGTVGMENPASGDHVAIVAARLRVADVPVDAEGISRAALEASGAEVAVCTPAHQFPLGMSMSPARRSELLAWADETLGWIVEDDYDSEFRYDRRPIGALQSRRPSRIVHVGSTSKTLGPAVRLGWIACPPYLLEPLVEAKRRARPTSPLDQLALARMIDTGGYDRHLRTVRRAYRLRRNLLTEAVRTGLPRARVLGVEAGLHAILELPAGSPDETTIVDALRAASVHVHALGDYERPSPRSRPRPSLVVGYGTPPSYSYPAAIGALVDRLRTLTSPEPGP